MRNTLLIALSLGLFTSALADTNIPNTRVSYKVKQDPMYDQNASMVFVDDSADRSGKTYAAFVCDSGDAQFLLYSPTILGSYAGEKLDFSIRADKGVVKSGLATLQHDNQTGRLSRIEMGYGVSMEILTMFMSAKNQVVIRVDRSSGSAVTYTFPTKGFMQAYRAINSCE
ncbi:hypothetical protein Dxin01_03386 [Deinococcus xinjiangensis]|uniref:Uncharacterized protein n=1 Tax=Deinococcus xinjiangensis TaxID=457454 RepID=A0ABP9VEI4_9DEIO